MRILTTVLAFAAAGGAFAQPTLAQPPPTMATVITIAAPVFSSADDRQTPIGVAAIGSVFRVIGTTEGWYQVNFDDPQTGLRVRFIKMVDARLLLPNTSHRRQWTSGSTAPLPDAQTWAGPIFQ